MLHSYDSPPPQAHLLKAPRPPVDTSGKLTAALSLSPRHRAFLFAAVLALQLLLLFSARSSSHLRRPPPHPPTAAATTTTITDSCASGKVFVYDLPPFFNKDLVDSCADLNPWNSRCDALSNNGFGRTASCDLSGVVPSSLLPSWFGTDQFAAEIIYHRRILAHRCRTLSPTDASAFYIPFYAGLAVGKHLWSSDSTSSGERDVACAALLRWIRDQEPWTRYSGRDHFITLGRITWDFRRSRDDEWGGRFLYMPGMENVSRLLIERNPWDEKDIGVPYPTGFHPKSASEVREWQHFVLNRTRAARFSFAGAARAGFKNDFRKLLLDECAQANGTCRSLDCGGGRCGNSSRETLGLFLDSEFCLQPRGDSFTRRSMFDCMLAGAIPVLFWKRSAYVQYEWYLNSASAEEWSVFIDRGKVREGAVSVREALEGIGEERVKSMREKVVEMIPRLLYGGAEEGIRGGIMDAFDVALDGVLRRLRDRGNGDGDGR